jgi:hypothetical protein
MATRKGPSGASLASCTDNDPDLDWGDCSPGEERFITVTRDGDGTTLTALAFSGGTGSFEITSLDGTAIGPFSCATYQNLDLALGDSGALLYGEAVTVGISSAYDDGAEDEMAIAILNANGDTVATRTATATVQDPFLALCETHGDLLYIYGARDLPTGDLSGDGAVVFEDLSSVGAPDIVYKKHAGQSVLWRTLDDDPCGVSSVLAKCNESDYRAGQSDPAAYQYAIAQTAPGIAKSFLVFIQFAEAMLDCRDYCDWVMFGGVEGAPHDSGGSPTPRPRSIDPYGGTGYNVSIGNVGKAGHTSTYSTFSQGAWFCMAHADITTNTFNFAYTEMGETWGSDKAWAVASHGAGIPFANGLQMGYGTTHVNSKNQDGVRIAGIVGFSGIKTEAEMIALYNAAAGV